MVIFAHIVLGVQEKRADKLYTKYDQQEKNVDST